MGRISDHPEFIDVLQLTRDIHAFGTQSELHFDSLFGPMPVSPSYLTDFVQSMVRYIVAAHFEMRSKLYDSKDRRSPNWMLFLYHHKLSHSDTDIHCRLNVISPLLPLFHVDFYYDSDDADIISLISALILIRNNVPQSAPNGIDHQQINALTLSHSTTTIVLDTDHPTVMQSNAEWLDHHYQCLDFEQLFGGNVARLLWLDLCKLVVSFLDIPSLFRCCAVNHCWLHLVLRNDTLLSVFNDMADGDNLNCTLSDHSMCSQPQIPTAPLAIGWTFNLWNSRYLDFVTLKMHWFQDHVDSLTVTLQQKGGDALTDDHEEEWVDVEQRSNLWSNDIGFDSVFLLKIGTASRPKSARYRVRVDILEPFRSAVVYSNERSLNPLQWVHRYNEAKARDEDSEKYREEEDGNPSAGSKLFHIHKFWFGFYLDLMRSLNCNELRETLKNLRICDHRVRSDGQYLKSEWTKDRLHQVVRYLLHESDDIKCEAVRLVRRLAIQDTDQLKAYYLSSLADGGVIKMCERHLLDTRADVEHEVVGDIREQMLWFLGYFAKSGVRWKQKLMDEMDIGSFLQFMIDEIEINRKAKYTASYVWTLSKFFSLHEQSKADDVERGLDEILTVSLGQRIINLLWSTFHAQLQSLKALQTLKDTEDVEDGTEIAEQIRLRMEGHQTMVRDVYYASTLLLRYFKLEIVDVVSMDLLRQMVSKITGTAMAMENEFAIRMVGLTMNGCVDCMLRQNVGMDEILEFGYLDQMESLLDGIAQKLEHLISTKKEAKSATEQLANDESKSKEDLFMILFAAILESIAIVIKNAENVSASHEQVGRLVRCIVGIVPLHQQYVHALGREAAECEERASKLHDQHCCVMSVLWDSMLKYGRPVRHFVANNDHIMALIEKEWARSSDLILSNQAQSLLVVLTDDAVFEALSGGASKGDDDEESESKAQEVLCPCGDVLQLVPAKDCYEPSAYTYLYCDYCREKVDWGLHPMRMVYHCDKKEKAHPHGFDLCVVCAKKKLVLDAGSKLSSATTKAASPPI